MVMVAKICSRYVIMDKWKYRTQLAFCLINIVCFYAIFSIFHSDFTNNIFFTYAVIDAAPTSVTLSLTSLNILISWNQTSLCQYAVQVSTMDGYQALNTTVNYPMIIVNRNHSINILEISSCSSNSTFIIGMDYLIF